MTAPVADEILAAMKRRDESTALRREDLEAAEGIDDQIRVGQLARRAGARP